MNAPRRLTPLAHAKFAHPLVCQESQSNSYGDSPHGRDQKTAMSAKCDILLIIEVRMTTIVHYQVYH